MANSGTQGRLRERGGGSLEGPTRKPRHASSFSMHSDTQAVPAFQCISEGPKGGRRKGAGVANCRIFRSAVPSVVVWSILSPCFRVWGEEKVMTIYDAGPLAAGPLCGLLSIRMFKGIFRHASVFKMHRHAVYHCLKRSKNHFDTLAFVKRSRFDTRVSVFKMRVFPHLREGERQSPLRGELSRHAVAALS